VYNDDTNSTRRDGGNNGNRRNGNGARLVAEENSSIRGFRRGKPDNDSLLRPASTELARSLSVLGALTRPPTEAFARPTPGRSRANAINTVPINAPRTRVSKRVPGPKRLVRVCARGVCSYDVKVRAYARLLGRAFVANATTSDGAGGSARYGNGERTVLGRRRNPARPRLTRRRGEERRVVGYVASGDTRRRSKRGR